MPTEVCYYCSPRYVQTPNAILDLEAETIAEREMHNDVAQRMASTHV